MIFQGFGNENFEVKGKLKIVFCIESFVTRHISEQMFS